MYRLRETERVPSVAYDMLTLWRMRGIRTGDGDPNPIGWKVLGASALPTVGKPDSWANGTRGADENTAETSKTGVARRNRRLMP
jgi:hypothetical protein